MSCRPHYAFFRHFLPALLAAFAFFRNQSSGVRIRDNSLSGETAATLSQREHLLRCDAYASPDEEQNAPDTRALRRAIKARPRVDQEAGLLKFQIPEQNFYYALKKPWSWTRNHMHRRGLSTWSRADLFKDYFMMSRKGSTDGQPNLGKVKHGQPSLGKINRPALVSQHMAQRHHELSWVAAYYTQEHIPCFFQALRSLHLKGSAHIDNDSSARGVATVGRGSVGGFDEASNSKTDNLKTEQNGGPNFPCACPLGDLSIRIMGQFSKDNIQFIRNAPKLVQKLETELFEYLQVEENLQMRNLNLQKTSRPKSAKNEDAKKSGSELSRVGDFLKILENGGLGTAAGELVLVLFLFREMGRCGSSDTDSVLNRFGHNDNDDSVGLLEESGRTFPCFLRRFLGGTATHVTSNSNWSSKTNPKDHHGSLSASGSTTYRSNVEKSVSILDTIWPHMEEYSWPNLALAEGAFPLFRLVADIYQVQSLTRARYLTSSLADSSNELFPYFPWEQDQQVTRCNKVKHGKAAASESESTKSSQDTVRSLYLGNLLPRAAWYSARSMFNGTESNLAVGNARPGTTVSIIEKDVSEQSYTASESVSLQQRLNALRVLIGSETVGRTKDTLAAVSYLKDVRRAGLPQNLRHSYRRSRRHSDTSPTTGPTTVAPVLLDAILSLLDLDVAINGRGLTGEVAKLTSPYSDSETTSPYSDSENQITGISATSSTTNQEQSKIHWRNAISRVSDLVLKAISLPGEYGLTVDPVLLEVVFTAFSRVSIRTSWLVGCGQGSTSPAEEQHTINVQKKPEGTSAWNRLNVSDPPDWFYQIFSSNSDSDVYATSSSNAGTISGSGRAVTTAVEQKSNKDTQISAGPNTVESNTCVYAMHVGRAEFTGMEAVGHVGDFWPESGFRVDDMVAMTIAQSRAMAGPHCGRAMRKLISYEIDRLLVVNSKTSSASSQGKKSLLHVIDVGALLGDCGYWSTARAQWKGIQSRVDNFDWNIHASNMTLMASTPSSGNTKQSQNINFHAGWLLSPGALASEEIRASAIPVNMVSEEYRGFNTLDRLADSEGVSTTSSRDSSRVVRIHTVLNAQAILLGATKTLFHNLMSGKEAEKSIHNLMSGKESTSASNQQYLLPGEDCIGKVADSLPSNMRPRYDPDGNMEGEYSQWRDMIWRRCWMDPLKQRSEEPFGPSIVRNQGGSTKFLESAAGFCFDNSSLESSDISPSDILNSLPRGFVLYVISEIDFWELSAFFAAINLCLKRQFRDPGKVNYPRYELAANVVNEGTSAVHLVRLPLLEEEYSSALLPDSDSRGVVAVSSSVSWRGEYSLAEFWSLKWQCEGGDVCSSRLVNPLNIRKTNNWGTGFDMIFTLRM